MLSFPEEAARRWLAGCNEQERGWATRFGRESWIRPMSKVEELRLPLAFGQSQPSISLSEAGALATMQDNVTDEVAASTVVMWAGRHYAEFSQLEEPGGAGHLSDVSFGVIRPGWEVLASDTTETFQALEVGFSSFSAIFSRKCRKCPLFSCI